MAKEYRIDCPHCKASLNVDGEYENIWFDTGDEVLLVPREMLKYLEDSQGIIGMTYRIGPLEGPDRNETLQSK